MKADENSNEKEIEELEKHLKDYRQSHKVYIRLLAVRMVKMGETRTKTGDYLHVNRRTVSTWVKSYDNEGIDGLIPDYSNCGLNCKLSDEELLELKEIITDPDANYDIKGVQALIENRYHVKYTYKQTWVIVRKKLGLNYRKPVIYYGEAPDNPNGIFKKKRTI